MSWDLYNKKLTATGYTARQRQLNQSREDFLREAVKNPAFHIAKRNEVEQPFLITRTEVPEKYKIVAFPGDDLVDGDYIDVFGERFLVIQTRVQDTLQKNGIMWLCNHEFVWQNFSSDIVKRWGVLDSGVYSSTIMGEAQARSKNKQFKLYFPLDEATNKIFVDKRLACDKMFDQFGNEILNVYHVTGYDATSESFGAGAHLLILNLRSDEYNRKTDNTELMICDYIAPGEDTPTDLLDCDISGTDYIRLGTHRKYSAVFYTATGEIVDDVTAVWSVESAPNDVTFETNGNKITITVPNEDELLDQQITISLTDSAGNYETISKTIDIIGL